MAQLFNGKREKPAPAPREARQERLAAALRANLARRKAQARRREAVPKKPREDE